MHKFIMAIESEPRPFYKDVAAIGSPPSNYKTDKAISDWTERRTEQIHEEAGRTPILANVTGVLIKDLSNSGKVQTLDAKDAYEFVTNCSRDSVMFYTKHWSFAWRNLINSLMVDGVPYPTDGVPYIESTNVISTIICDPLFPLLGGADERTISTFVNYAKLIGLLSSKAAPSDIELIEAVLKFGQVIPA